MRVWLIKPVLYSAFSALHCRILLPCSQDISQSRIMSYQFSLLRIEHVVHLLKSQNGVLNAQEKRTFPANGSSHWGLILEDWRFVSIGFEQCIHGIHLMNGKIKLGLMFLLTILLKIKPRSWSHLASALDWHVVWIAQESNTWFQTCALIWPLLLSACNLMDSHVLSASLSSSHLCTNALQLGDSRKYPYHTTDGFHILTPLAFRISKMRYPPMPSDFHNRKLPPPVRIFHFFVRPLRPLICPISVILRKNISNYSTSVPYKYNWL